LASFILLWKSYLDAIAAETVEDSKFKLTNAVFQDKWWRIAKRGRKVFSRLQGAVVRGRKDDVELMARKVAAGLAGLLMAMLRQWGLQITKADVERVLSGSFRNVFGYVSRGFSVAYDD